MSAALKGKVYLAGAGPGDPDLLTVRTLRLLQTADVVLHDDLVTDEVLACIGAAAQVASVGKRYGQPRVTQTEIHARMVAAAQAGQSVVRLKSGDPLVFGRAAEEIEALRAADVPFEIVPGVSAVFAAGATLELPLTDRSAASKLVLMTAHRAAETSSTAPVWQGTLPDDATLAIYMPGRDFNALAMELARAGVAADTPCIAVSRAASAQQSVVRTRLQALGETVPGAAPVLLLVGRAMETLMDDDARRLVAIVADRSIEEDDEPFS